MPELIREPRKIGPGDPEEEPMWLRVLTGLLGFPTGGAGLDIATALATLPLLGISSPKMRLPVKLWKHEAPIGLVAYPTVKAKSFDVSYKTRGQLMHELGHVASVREVPTLLRGASGKGKTPDAEMREFVREILANIYMALTNEPRAYMREMKELSDLAPFLGMTKVQFMKHAKERPLKLLHEAVDLTVAPTQIKRDVWNIPFINLVKRLREKERWVPGQKRVGRP